jgi:O-6-methylguanine DNA methyltransferase
MAPAEHDGLRALAAPAPPRFDDRVVARWSLLASPVGDVFVVTTDIGIAYVAPAGPVGGFDGLRSAVTGRVGRPLVPAEHAPAGVEEALASGRAAHLVYDLGATSSFGRDVLAAALEIPPGEVRPYGWIARRIGRPAAVRAVGTALGRNPVPLLIPCHRVVRTDGVIGQYAYGTELKRRLLEVESASS